MKSNLLTTLLLLAGVLSTSTANAAWGYRVPVRGLQPIVGAPVVTANPTALDFGTLVAGTTSKQTVTLTNTGTADLSALALSLSPAVGPLTLENAGSCANGLVMGASCTVTVSASPTAVNPLTNGTYTLSAGSTSIPVSGNTFVPAPGSTLSAGTLSFGTLDVGQTSSAQTINLKNTGNVAFSVTSVSTTGDFAASQNCGSLPFTLQPGASCSVNITFKPLTKGAASGGGLSIGTSIGMKSVTLTGTGSTPLSLTLGTSNLPDATRLTAYSFDFKSLLSMSGDTQPSITDISWSTVGTLPAGLALSSTGVLSGTPTTRGSGSFDVVATYTDKKGQLTYTLNVNGTLVDAVQISGGLGFTCALTGSGTVKCWGADYYGQIGNGTISNNPVLTPKQVINLNGPVASITSGPYHTCAVLVNGDLECWGVNGDGQLGSGDSYRNMIHETPVYTSNIAGVAQASGGRSHTCAVLKNGGLKCWGYNRYGELGIGNYIAVSNAAPVPGWSSGVRYVGVNHQSSCLLSTAGAVYCTGDNPQGGLGDGTTTTRNLFTPVQGLSGSVKKLLLGNTHTCALMTNGTMKCWGGNNLGQIGKGVASTAVFTPTDVVGLSGALDAFAGSNHTCALLSGGTVKCWGDNSSGQLGTGNSAMTYSATPVDVVGITGATSIATGVDFACVTTSSGGLSCWGNNSTGQLGTGATGGATYSPVQANW